MPGMDLPVASAALSGGGAYRVLARKYRPQTFSELIGQDAMVQTLANAIKRDRLAHAFLMTGVRGVGKTSTARLIAKGLNCIGADGQGGPTIEPCGVCYPCIAVAEGRHIDVIEMDAASHTGVDDVREIIEAVRYAAVSARYKIYIIDEVHMLSKNAFNALLKTLEEPPSHVKFIFATTEVNKVPVTVLSRCQRFDLRRITPDLLFAHFKRICAREAVEAEDRALWMVAAAAEGSVRDGLSILDQAIAHADFDGDGKVTASQVRDMLGLSDGGVTRSLLGHILAGDSGPVIDTARAQYALGVEPVAMVRGLMALAHGIALARVSRSEDPSLAPEDAEAISAWARQIGMARIQRFWQLLLRAHAEVTDAADPLEALEMALLRICHAATMPDPDELARLLSARDGAGQFQTGNMVDKPDPGQQASGSDTNVVPISSAMAPAGRQDNRLELGAPSLADLVDQLSKSGELLLAAKVRRDARIVSIISGRIDLAASSGFSEAEASALAAALTRSGSIVWKVTLVDAEGGPTLMQSAAESAARAEAEIRAHPIVNTVLNTFPGAELLAPTGSASPSIRNQRS